MPPQIREAKKERVDLCCHTNQKQMLVVYHELQEAQHCHNMKVSYSVKIVFENPLFVHLWEDDANAPLIVHSQNTVSIEVSSNIFQHHHLKDNNIGSITNVKFEHE